MFEPPDHYHNLSLRLSEVLDDIGVNERIVMKRRSFMLLQETMANIETQISGRNESVFLFGSRSEGSTTQDLKSDIDYLTCFHVFRIMHDLSDWRLQPDKLHLLMIQDETTSPGYCLLQLLRPDAPLPVEELPHEATAKDSRGRIIMKHSFVLPTQEGIVIHGPAETKQGVPGLIDNDNVFAILCPSWPKEAEPWLQQQNMNGWPTEDMKRYAAEHGCFVVPAASRESSNQDTEWRISTSHAERCLMFSINMTQLRCYILMKMILKTFFKPMCEDAITSFMCKNVLFHRIADSTPSEWKDSNLIARLIDCLRVLFKFILTENCPHFIIHRNNLLAGKLSIPVKYQLVEIISYLTGNIEQSLLGISIDQLSERIHMKSEGKILPGYLSSPALYAGQVIASLILNNVEYGKDTQNLMLNEIKEYHQHSVFVYQSLIQVISTLCQIYSVGSKMEQRACRSYTPILCATLGSIAASIGIYHFQAISPVARMWFSAGLNTDHSSSRLKLASALYCARHNEQCETILADLGRRLDLIPVLSVCCCYFIGIKIREEFSRICYEKNEEDVVKQDIAFCVTFLPCEIYCVPEELRYEFFRSTAEDRAYRGRDDYWMDWAAVDSLTYLYFMEYKVYSQLNRRVEQHRAVNTLIRTINIERKLKHRETALNLLGQCMEKENRLNAALCCYMISLNERRRNNAANWHVCRLFARLFRHRQ